MSDVETFEQRLENVTHSQFSEASCLTMSRPTENSGPSIPLTAAEIRLAARRISPFIQETPVLRSEVLDNMAGLELFFKAENLQVTGSFKVRGALNDVLTEQERTPGRRGVVGESSGNFGVGLAYAAKHASMSCHIVLARDTPAHKVEFIRRAGTEVVLCGNTHQDRLEVAAQVAAREGLHLVSSYGLAAVAGHGTAGLELVQQVRDLDAVVVAVSGGGLIASVATIVKDINPRCKVYAVEPAGKKLGESLQSATRAIHPAFLNTVAHSLALAEISEDVFPILCQLVEPNVISVTDGEMLGAVKLALTTLKVVLEPAAGAVLAGCLQLGRKDPSLRRVGAVLCGSNTNLDELMDVITRCG